uniref:DENN domain containing 2C n=1 Tax=Cyprinus carpio carpio TaxID=630221 RepID=A0A8C1E5N2_CYPCA
MLALGVDHVQRGGNVVAGGGKTVTMAAWPIKREPAINIKQKISQWEGLSQQEDVRSGNIKPQQTLAPRRLSGDFLGNGLDGNDGGHNKATVSKAKSLGLDFRENQMTIRPVTGEIQSDFLRNGTNSNKFVTSTPVTKHLSTVTQSQVAKLNVKSNNIKTNHFTDDKITSLPQCVDDPEASLPPGNFYTSRGFWKRLEADDSLWEKDSSMVTKYLGEIGPSSPPPKPQRTFQYKGASSPPGQWIQLENQTPSVSKSNQVRKHDNILKPPSCPPPPCPVNGFSRNRRNRKSFEFEDVVRLTDQQACRGKEGRRSGLFHAWSEDSIYEDVITDISKENPYEDVRLTRMCLPIRRPRNYTVGQRESPHIKLVTRIQEIFEAKRGRKRVWATATRDELSGTESDPEESSKDRSQRTVYIQSTLKRRPGYRTLERDLIQLQEQQLFQQFVVVSLRKASPGNTYIPEITQQFPTKFEKSSRLTREAEDRLRAIPKFCFPDCHDWRPSSDHTSETFSFVLTGEDGSRLFGYCRKILPSGKGKRLPEVHCIISRLGCFNLFSKILEEVERRREISPALVHPFMHSVMEAPFPAPGRTITVKSFLPGSGNEVLTLCRPVDSRLEHVDFESLLQCLSVTRLLQVFASLLLERRVIFIADKLGVLSRCAHSALALLYPFTWQHTFVPVLPASMLDICCSPTPFVMGALSPSLPEVLDMPIEEVLIVDLCADKFVVQLGDEDCILPRKLQAALQEILDNREEILEQNTRDRKGDQPDLSTLVSEAFVWFFVELVGHYSLFMSDTGPGGTRELQRDAFRKSHPSRGVRQFLQLFMDTQMFAGFIHDRELRKGGVKGLFEMRAAEYLDSYPEPEPSGVNKFFKGLGNKMKFLQKK